MNARIFGSTSCAAVCACATVGELPDPARHRNATVTQATKAMIVNRTGLFLSMNRAPTIVIRRSERPTDIGARPATIVVPLTTWQGHEAWMQFAAIVVRLTAGQ